MILLPLISECKAPAVYHHTQILTVILWHSKSLSVHTLVSSQTSSMERFTKVKHRVLSPEGQNYSPWIPPLTLPVRQGNEKGEGQGVWYIMKEYQ